MKIKSVDIVGFRAYAHKGDGLFDFHNKKGEVSNFISIYAPNGFGKSSFYDAMEWSITNNISRYIRDSLRVINQGTSKTLNCEEVGQRILRNRYIADNDPAYVQVITTDDFKFLKSVKRPRRGARDYTYDPSDTNPDTKHLLDIFLSQDAIDSFLKEERPEVRYEKFMTNFGGGDEKYRKKLSSLIKTSLKEISDLQSKITKLETISTEPEFDFSIEEVNKTITKLDESGISFTYIDSTFSEVDSIEKNTKIQKIIFELKNILNQVETSKQEILACINSLPELLILENSFEKNKNYFEGLKNNKEQLLNLAKIISNKSELENNRKNLVLIKRNIENILNKLPESLDIKKNIENKKLEIITFISSLEKLDLEVSNLLNTNEKLNLDKLEANTKLADLQSQEKGVDYQFSLIQKNENILASNREKIIDIEGKKVKYESLLRSIQSNYDLFSNLKVEKVTISNELISLLKPESDFIFKFNHYLILQEKLNSDLLSLEKQAQEIGYQSDKFLELISIAITVITASKSDKCPVCKSEHGTYENLFDKIINSSGVNLSFNLVSKSISEKKNQLKEVEGFLNKGLEYLNGLKNSSLIQIKDQKNKIASDVFELNSQLEMLTTQNKKYIADLSLLRIYTQNLSKEFFLTHLHKNISDFRSLIYNIELELLSNNEKQSTLKREINENSLRKLALELSLAELNNSPVYTFFCNEKISNSIEDEQELQQFSAKLADFSVSLDQVNISINSLDDEIKLLEDDISKNNKHSLLTTLDDEILSISKDRDDVLMSINKIKTNISKYILVNEFNINNFSLILNNLSEETDFKINKLKSNLLDLNIFEYQISKTLPFFQYWEAQKEISQIKDRLVDLDLLILRMKLDLVVVKKRLLNRIDEFFYTQLINKIYKKIDPHPFFKDVSFQCVFNDEEKPRLEIYLYEKNNHTPISPSLYFSSAQLNILSLSIFLARALHVEHKGKPVSTILIDDPIQSMDSINVLATIDLLRNISIKFDKQIILSTHDENFHELLKLKIPESEFGSKFIRFSSYGKVVQD